MEVSSQLASLSLGLEGTPAAQASPQAPAVPRPPTAAAPRQLSVVARRLKRARAGRSIAWHSSAVVDFLRQLKRLRREDALTLKVRSCT